MVIGQRFERNGQWYVITSCTGDEEFISHGRGKTPPPDFIHLTAERLERVVRKADELNSIINAQASAQ